MSRFGLFNSYENGARLLIQDMPLPVAPELSAGALVVIGFGKMGRTVALQFLRAAPTALGQKMRVIVGRPGEIEEVGTGVYGQRTGGARIRQFRIYLGGSRRPTRPQIGASITEKIADEPLLAVVTCLAEDFDNLFVGMEMRRLLDAHDQFHVPIYVRLHTTIAWGDTRHRPRP